MSLGFLDLGDVWRRQRARRRIQSTPAPWQRDPHAGFYTAEPHPGHGLLDFGVVTRYGVFDHLADRFVLTDLHSLQHAQARADELNRGAPDHLSA